MQAERTSVHDDVGCASASSGGDGCGDRGTSSRAAGLCDARASFPHPHADAPFTGDLGKFDVDPVGEEGMAFEAWPDGGQVDLHDVVDEDDQVWVAHRHGRALCVGREAVAQLHGVYAVRYAHVDGDGLHRMGRADLELQVFDA